MAYQVPYHNLDVPLNPPVEPPPYSSLHLLYPGMPMIQNDVPDRYYIPHACPEEDHAAFIANKINTIEAARLTENLARLSSGNKVTIRAVEDPSAIVEDPALSGMTTHPPIAFNDGMDTKPRRRKLREHFSAANITSRGGNYSYILYLIIAVIFAALVCCLVFMK